MAELSRARIREVARHSKLLWFLPVFAPVLGLVCVASWNDPKQRALAEFWALVVLAICVISLLVGYYRHRDRKFLRWLLQNSRALASRSATLEGRAVTRESVLVRYEVHVGFFVTDATFHTPYRLKDHRLAVWDKAVAVALTLLLGWWAIPWGPFVVVGATVRNLRNGSSQSVGEVLSSLAGFPAA